MDIPGWLASAAPNSSLNTRDMRDLFKLTDTQLAYRVRQGKFPKPDWEATRQSNHKPSKQWRVSTILSFLKGI
jgi:hypothetical protein